MILSIWQSRPPSGWTTCDVPTCLEQGVNLSYDLMYYVMFPKGTDPAICQKFAQAFKEISEMPEYAEEIKTAYNQTPYFLDTEESIAYIQEENEKMMAYATTSSNLH